MLKRFIACLVFVILSVSACAVELPQQGDWVRFKLMRAHEWSPVAVDYITITVGPREGDGQWWQLVGEKNSEKKIRQFVVQCLSQKVPLASMDGELGKVYRYIFKQDNMQTLEYVDKWTGLAYLPRIGFRDGLVPTPRSEKNIVGPFYATANYIGQPLSAQGHGSSGKWMELGEIKKLELDDDLLVGTSRWMKDDGNGPGPDGEYKYIEWTAQDYDEVIKAGFNYFITNNKHIGYVREQPVFFTKSNFAGDRYPELLYRSNFFAERMYVDEPLSRLDATDCRTVYDAVNLLKTRNHSYHLEPGKDPNHRSSAVDSIIAMINEAGYKCGDWYPKQDTVASWDTYYEGSFYQMMAGSIGGTGHEGRYSLKSSQTALEMVFGPGIENYTVNEMLDSTYVWMRGAVRCLGGDWAMSIYGQADYSVAPDAVKRAYDMGSRYIWFWTSDHDHHVPYARQLELARIIRQHQQEHPRRSRQELNRKARVAVAIPEGYLNLGYMMWWNQRFDSFKINECGVPYGDVCQEMYWQIYKLAKSGVDYDCVVNYPSIIDKAGYEKIIRVYPDGSTNQPDPQISQESTKLTLSKPERVAEYEPAKDAPKTTAAYAKPVVDGKLDEWSKASWIALNKQIAYDDPDLVWHGRDDLSARAAVAYDDDSLYIAVEVNDDIQEALCDSDLIWQNDSVQIGLDPLTNPTEDGFYSIDDIELGLALVDDRPYAHIWYGRISPAKGEMPEADVKITREGTVTRYEARIPLASIRPFTPAYPGMCGMDIVANDNDGEGRKGALCWTSGIADGKHTSKWGVLSFSGRSSAPEMVYLQRKQVVVKAGQSALFTLDTGAASDTDAQIELSVRHGNAHSQPSASKLMIPKGRHQIELGVDTTGLESDSYYADFTIESNGKTIAQQSIKFFVMP